LRQYSRGHMQHNRRLRSNRPLGPELLVWQTEPLLSRRPPKMCKLLRGLPTAHPLQLLTNLTALPQANNTIVIFTTHNGAEVFTWPDGGMTPFKNTKGTVGEWQRAIQAP
jgi:hypothetical protein